ncbi:dihydroorotate dehydrogenase electron transfer subunit [Hydrogenibacillus sp. N12]|uniref:dihydroorotate dehydrogenase electron transfer subunit n=1 Tax=Hydrogenibacillus sp. N12 TaxID=2866627 RepID=UPI001C7CE00C|nr:dihydroorotate dehydrogenase electron transfer subunit [Hydrogenibacillus sp. N12]QZA33971.1 dihydroorotate dehydrogenase electron transfer subunit [Hydrogenibacillus sp. N12]
MRTGATRIVGRRAIGRSIVELALAVPPAFPEPRPGQFVHVRVPGDDLILRRPLSVADWDEKERVLRLIFRVVGEGTARLAALPVGTAVDAFLPPSTGFPLSAVRSGETALLVGGGLGVAPLIFLARALHSRGVRVKARIGFACAENVFGLRRLRAVADVELYTDDGSAGAKGRVTDGLGPEAAFHAAFACGPEPMLRALQRMFRGDGRPIYAALEARMACGAGVCRACVVPVAEGSALRHRRVCRDGPVFALASLHVAGVPEGGSPDGERGWADGGDSV